MISSPHLRALFDILGETGERMACTLHGNCMAPLLQEDDLLVIQHGTEAIRVGDLIIFDERGRLVVQRVLSVDRRQGRVRFLVKADQRASFHGPVARDQILGKVVEARGSNGRLRFDSLLWRHLNRVLALRSYVLGRTHTAATPFWKAANGLLRLRSKVLPGNLSISLLPYRAICWVHRMRSRGRPNRMDNRREE